MRLSRLLFCLALTLLSVPFTALAQTPDANPLGDLSPTSKKKNPVTAKLLADTSTIVAGKPFLAGVQLTPKPGWHTYWEFPGDSGMPTSIEWQLPAGFTAGRIQWPMPSALIDENDFLTYTYQGEVLLLVEITPPAQLPPGEITLKAHTAWLTCEKLCIPGEADLTLALKAADAATPNNTDLFSQWRAQLPKTSAPFPVQWDTSNPKELKLTVSDVPKEAKLEFFPLPPEDAVPERPKVTPPDANGARTVTLKLTTPAKPGGVWRGLLVAQSADSSPREGWLISSDRLSASTNAAATPPPAPAKPTAPSSGLAGGKPAKGFFEVLFAAFFGGLILNIMPCVLPVISLKIFGFVNQGGDDPKRVARLGLAFAGGVFAFFLAIATVVAFIGKSFTWGFQNSDPRLLTALIVIVFVFGLNMLGVFELTLSSGATSTMSDLSAKEGYGGAFLHGLFTTLLGSSCTAPFLATALGYATKQSVPVIFLLFIAMAAGLSLPYLILTQRPVWLKYLPKPGAWMERFKQLMGFVMLAYAVFLFTSFVAAGTPDSAIAMVWFLFVLGLAAWLFGVLNQTRPLAGALAALLLAAGGYFFFLHGKLDAAPSATAGAPVAENGLTWQPFSDEAIGQAIQAGKPVFIDFTAAWCINCKYYEGQVLAADSVTAALREKGVQTFRADWTRRNPKITEWLNKFDRIGVPVYVLYRPGETEPVVQDGLTRDGFLAELGKIHKP